MAAGRETREAAMRDIARALSRNGPAHDLRPLKSRKYADVPNSTWLRWVKAVRDSGAPGRKAAKRIKRKASQRAKQAKPMQDAAQAVAEQLPEVIKPEDVAGTGVIPAMDRIRECLQDALRVKDFCETDNGKIRNPKMYLAASRHMLDSLKTAAYIAGQLMDAQRIDQFHQAILNRLKERDPVLVEQILCDMERLNKEWGSAV